MENPVNLLHCTQALGMFIHSLHCLKVKCLQMSNVFINMLNSYTFFKVLTCLGPLLQQFYFALLSELFRAQKLNDNCSVHLIVDRISLSNIYYFLKIKKIIVTSFFFFRDIQSNDKSKLPMHRCTEEGGLFSIWNERTERSR